MTSWVGARSRPSVGKFPRRRAFRCSLAAAFAASLALLLMVIARDASSAPGAGAGPLPSPDAATRTYLAAVEPPHGGSSSPPERPALRPPELDKGVFLVASPELRDPNFFHTVVLLVEYDQNGAMGLVINRPTEIALTKALPHVGELEDRADRVYFGGPVARDTVLLLVRSAAEPSDASHVFADIYVSLSARTLREVLREQGRRDTFQAYAGYAGWAPGQLEDEIDRGDWHLSRADAEMVFRSDPEQLWPELIRRTSGFWVRRGAAVAKDAAPR